MKSKNNQSYISRFFHFLWEMQNRYIYRCIYKKDKKLAKKFEKKRNKIIKNSLKLTQQKLVRE